jgi:hypothetical protein
VTKLQKKIRAEIDRRLAAGEITAEQHAAALAHFAKVDARPAAAKTAGIKAKP